MIRAVIRFLLSTVLCLFILVALLIQTQTGLEMLYKVGKEFVPGTFEIKSLQGKLLGPLRLEGIHYKDNYVDTHIDSISLSWEPLSLFSHTLKVYHLNVEGLSLRLLTDASSSTDTTHIETDTKAQLYLPFNINLDDVVVANTHLYYEDNSTLLDIDNAHLHGNLLPNGKQSFHVEWDTLNIPITKEKSLTSTHGFMSLQGTLPSYNVNTHSQFSLPGMEKAYATLVAVGDFNEISIERLSLEENANHLALSGEVNWQNDVFINLTSLTGMYDNHSIDGKTTVVFRDKETLFSPSFLSLDKAKLTFSGTMGKTWDVAWQADIPDFNYLLPKALGKFSSEGSISGTANALSVKATANLENFSFEDYSVKNASFLVDAHQDLSIPSTLKLEAKEVKYEDNDINTLNLQASNQQNHQQINLSLSDAKRNLETQLQGSWKKNHWEGNLSQLTLKSQKLPSISLQKPVLLQLSKNSIKVSSLCLQTLDATICGEGYWKENNPWSLQVNSSNIDLKNISSYFSQDITATGIVKLNMNLKGAGSKLAAQSQTQLTLSSGSIYSKSNKDLPVFRFNGLNISALLDQKGLKGNIALLLPNQPPLQVSLFLSNFSDIHAPLDKQSLEGTITFNSSNLKPFIILINNKLKNLTGNLNINLKLAGTLAEPEIRGEARLGQGNISIPSIGANFKDINISIRGDNSDKLNYIGTVISGKGQLNLKGNTILHKPFNTDLSLEGKDFQVMNTDEYKIAVSPRLSITSDNGNIFIKGDINIPTALITPIDLSSNVTLSKDVVFVDVKKPQESSLHITSEVKITLGDDILVSYKGLKAKLLGEVNVADTAQSTTIGKGKIYIEKGTFKSYGQNLNIRRGEFIFSGGPVDNPGLAIEAVKSIRTVLVGNVEGKSGAVTQQGLSQDEIVGLRVSGTLDEPHMTFFSEPSGMSQEDILSYLVLGRPSSNNSADASLLLNALSILNTGDSETSETKEKLQKNLGLDELAVQSEQEYSSSSQSTVENTSLVLGKALSPKLFLSYSIGLLEPINILRISYKLTNHISVRTESNTNAQGIDVFYTIEKD